MPFAGSKNRIGVEGRPLILTFGLLSPDKGIEHVIDALPTILAHYPDVVYIVLGATHPHIVERHGETYRLVLEERAKRLGVDGNVIFHNRFVSQSELSEFLAAADIYITPYLNPEQITSGTLAYALGAGKAVISTPYRYAKELLADGRGILVPWKDSSAIATEIVGLLDDPEKRYTLRRARRGTWPGHAVAGRRAFVSADLRARPHRTWAPPADGVPRQHARNAARGAAGRQSRPRGDDDRRHGHAAARHLHRAALRRGLLRRRQRPRADADDAPRRSGIERSEARAHRWLRVTWPSSATRSIAPSAASATSCPTRGFWREEQGSEDSHGRALWALGTVVGLHPIPAGRVSPARCSMTRFRRCRPSPAPARGRTRCSESSNTCARSRAIETCRRWDARSRTACSRSSAAPISRNGRGARTASRTATRVCRRRSSQRDRGPATRR